MKKGLGKSSRIDKFLTSQSRRFDGDEKFIHFYAVYSHHEPGQILVKNLSNDKKILDKLKFVKLTIQSSQTDKFLPVFDDPTTREILCVTGKEAHFFAQGSILWA